MKPILSVALCSLLFAFAASAQVKYSTYSNPRFGFSIEYPSELLVMQPPSFTGDGRVFTSKSGDAELRVWGQFNALFRSVAEERNEALKDYGQSVTYRKGLRNGFVISGLKDGKVFYQKTLYHKFKGVDVFYTFVLMYPVGQRKLYDPLVRRIANSFTFDPTADV